MTLGPLTNLALALEREPALPSLLRGYVLMGGAYRAPGNTTPTAEWNLHVDPDAAKAVFAAWAAACAADPELPRPLAMGLDVTERARLLPGHLGELALRGRPRRRRTRSSASSTTRPGSTSSSTTATTASTARSSTTRSSSRPRSTARSSQTQPVFVDVETGPGLAHAMTVADWRGLTGQAGRTLTSPIEADADAFLDRLIERVGDLAGAARRRGTLATNRRREARHRTAPGSERSSAWRRRPSRSCVGLGALGTFDATPDPNGIPAGSNAFMLVLAVGLLVGFVAYGAVEWLQTRRLDSIARQFDTRTIVLIPIAIAINVVLGQTVGTALKLPVYLDSIGTILVGVLAGPIAGAATGLLSNLAWTFLLAGTPFGSPYAWPFAIVAVEIGLLAGRLRLRRRASGRDPERHRRRGSRGRRGGHRRALGGLVWYGILPFYQGLCPDVAARPGGATSGPCFQLFADGHASTRCSSRSGSRSRSSSCCAGRARASGSRAIATSASCSSLVAGRHLRRRLGVHRRADRGARLRRRDRVRARICSSRRSSRPARTSRRPCSSSR